MTDWKPCPFCGGKLQSQYGSTGTTLWCDGCHGEMTFPAFELEVKAMWNKHDQCICRGTIKTVQDALDGKIRRKKVDRSQI